MALAIHHPTLPSSSPSRRRAFPRRPTARTGALCRQVRRRQCLSRLVVVALGTSGFVAATEVASAVGRALIESPAAPPAVAGGEWVGRRVVAGESLWSVAASLPIEADDLRPYVDELVRLNGGVHVAPGQVVRVPAQWAEAGR